MNLSRLLAAFALLFGSIAIATLSVSALTAPLPGGVPVGTPLADLTRIDLGGERNAEPASGPRILILFHEHDEWGNPIEAADEVAMYVRNVAGHFGPVETLEADSFEREMMADFDAVIYTPPDYPREPPLPILQELIEPQKPFLWAGAGLGEVLEKIPALRTQWGFTVGPAHRFVDLVTYRDRRMNRSRSSRGIGSVTVNDPSAVETFGQIWSGDIDLGPYAIRVDNFFHVVEVPNGFVFEDSPWLAFSDFLFEFLDPDRPERHRALVRLEDIGPYVDAKILQEIVDGLHERQVPFSMSVYSVWVDRNAKYELGTEIRLADRPEVVRVLKDAQRKGGTILFHGLTHQYEALSNPYSGTSGEDFEFYRAKIDNDDYVVSAGPVPTDSEEWVLDRVRQGMAELEEVGLGRPTIFEFPHYLGSRTSYEAIAPHFDARYERGSYFTGELLGRPDPRMPWDQSTAYPIYDIYDEIVLPENLGNVIPVGYNNHLPRSVEDILYSAELNRDVVRDGIGSFFYHPYLGPERLFQLVDGIDALGFEFVSPNEVLETWK